MLGRVLAAFRRTKLDQELSDEIEFHVAMAVEEKIKGGLSPEEAQDAARREFGGVEQVKETYRDARGLPLLESILSDCLHAFRRMRMDPLSTSTILLILSLGIGVTTAVFTIANAVLVQPLGIPTPQSAVILLSTNEREGTAFSVAEGVFVDWRARSEPVFELMLGSYETSMIWTGPDHTRTISVAKATADYFAFAGLLAIQGRLFDRTSEQSGDDDVVVLDEAFWRNVFGARPDIVGQKLVLDDRPYTVIGVAPQSRRLGINPGVDAWAPLAARHDLRSGGAVDVMARLRPGVSLEQAQASMTAIHNVIRREQIQDSQFGVVVRPLQTWLITETRPALIALTGAVGLLLLMSCVNVAGLLLARGIARRREFSIRASLGGGPTRLARQIVTENMVLTSLAGVGGWILGAVLVSGVQNIKGFYLPRLGEIRVDERLLLIAIGVTAVSGLLSGLVPAWRIVRGASRLYSGTITTCATTSRSTVRLHRLLVTAQIAVSLVLLCAAGLLLNTYIRLNTVEVGFSKNDVVSVDLRLPYKRYDAERSFVFHRAVMEDMRRLPGVLDVSAADHLPLQAVNFPYELSAGVGRKVEALARHVDTRYFHVLGVPLTWGREFEAADDTRAPAPVILNVEAARRLFGTERDALGKILRTNYKQRTVLQIVGVASNVRQLGLRKDPGPQLYLPLRFSSGGHVLARVSRNSGDLSAAMRKAVWRLDRGVPPPEVRPVNTWFEQELAKPKLLLFLLGIFAFAGLIIAGAGVYSVVSFNAARRTQEFGIRVALGADAGDILRLVLKQEAVVVVAGICIGIVAAHLATRLLDSMLYGVQPGDLPTLISACVLVLAFSSLACLLPAARATRIKASDALRQE